ncbi:hypothetical protein Tco_0887941 [Tanacetum coccineum]
MVCSTTTLMVYSMMLAGLSIARLMACGCLLGKLKMKYLSMVESENGKAKLMVESKKEKAKLMAKQTKHDLVDALDLENRIKKLKDDFSRLLKEKNAKEGNETELKMNKEVVQVYNDEGFSGDEDVVCFNDVKYLLTDDEIRMFKETLITARGPRRQLASTSRRSRGPIDSTTSRAPRRQLAFTSTRSGALIASTSSAQATSTSALRVYKRIDMTKCVLTLFAPNAPPPSASQKRKSKP